MVGNFNKKLFCDNGAENGDMQNKCFNIRYPPYM